MSLHNSMSFSAQQKRRDRDQSSGPRLSIYQELALDLWAAKNKADQIPTPENNARVADLEQQELLLIAILEGYIKPILSPRELAAQLAWRKQS
jgi:hypothetical protein